MRSREFEEAYVPFIRIWIILGRYLYIRVHGKENL